MNLVRFRSAGTARWGLLRGDRVFDVTPLTGAAPEAIHDWLDPARLAILEYEAVTIDTVFFAHVDDDRVNTIP